MDRTRLGRAAEDAAAAYLAARGMKLLARNFRTRRGELDLVCEDGDAIVFVEVRSRAAPSHGSAAESVDARKRARVIAAASEYLQRHGWTDRRPARFDVVALSGATVDWLRDAFRVEA